MGLRTASLYETEPLDGAGPGRFLNTVVRGRTRLGCRDLLEEALRVESALGRVRSQRRHAPRVIDIDVLLYGRAAVDEPGLVVPHPRMAERAFVLVPLLDLSPGLRDPGTGLTFSELLARLPDQGVYRLEGPQYNGASR